MAKGNTAVIGLLRVLLTAGTAEFDAGMKRSADSAKAWSREMRKIGQQATELGSTLARTFTLPIVGVGAAAAKVAIDFESSFAGVRKTVDATEPELAVLADGFRNLAKTIPVNVNELNKIGEAAGALGIKKDNIIEFAAVMAKLGVTTNLTAEEAANAIARIQNIFGAAGKDTERLASTIVALGNAGASTEKEIVEMGQRIAGAGHTVGLTQAQVLAFASTLSSVGINAEAGGSAISRIFLKMNDAVMKGGAGLAEFARVAGMSSGAFKKAFQDDAAGATQAFIAGLGRLKASGENINATIEGLTGKNIILKDTLFRLSGAGALLSDQLKIADKAWIENTALTKEAEQRFKTTQSQMILLGNRVRDVGITLGNALGPAIAATINGLNAFIPVLEKMAGMFAALPAGVQLGIIGFAGIVAAAGPAIYVFGQLALAASALTGAFAAQGVASKVLLMDLGFLGTAMRANLVAGAATVTQFGAMGAASIGATSAVRALGVAIAAMPFAAVAAGAAALTAAIVHLKTKAAEAQLAAATAEAKQHAINRAIEHGAKATISYAEAIEFNTDWEEKRIAAFNRAHRGANSLTEAQAQLTAANAKYKKELSGIEAALTFQIKHMGETGKTVQSLAKEFGISELTVTRFKASLEGSSAALRTNTGATNDNSAAKAKAIPLTSEQVQVQALLAKAHAHEAARLDFETAAWKRWEQAVSQALSTIKSSPVLLQGRNLSGAVPQVNAGGAGNMAGYVPPPAAGEGFLKSIFGSSAEFGQALAGTIMSAIQGGGNPVSAAAGMVGSKVGSSIAGMLKADGTKMFTGALGGIFSAALPVVGSLLGPLVSKIWGSLFGTEGRDTKIAMAKEMYGSVEAMQREMVATLSKSEYDRLWKQFSEVGQKNKDQAVAVHDAIAAAIARQKQQHEEVAAAAARTAEAQAASLEAIAEKHKAVIDGLKGELASFADRLQAEADAPEYDEMGNRIYGVEETLMMARKAALEQQIKNAEEARDAEIAAKKETFDATLTEAQDLDGKLREMFERGYKIPLTFEFPQGLSPSALSAGYDAGLTRGWESRMPPAALSARDLTVRVPLYLDGNVLAESVAKTVLAGGWT